MAKKTRKFRRAGRGAVLLITVMLVSSALLRLGSGAGQALAEAMKQSDMHGKEESMAMAGSATKSHDRAEMSQLLQALRDREKRVKELESLKP